MTFYKILSVLVFSSLLPIQLHAQYYQEPAPYTGPEPQIEFMDPNTSAGNSSEIGRATGISATKAAKATKKIRAKFAKWDPAFAKGLIVVIVSGIEHAAAYTSGGVITIRDDMIDWALAHELVHAMDQLHGTPQETENWNKLNPAGFSYLGVAEFAGMIGTQTPRVVESWKAYGCNFASQYSMADAAEDRAEIGAILLEGTSSLRSTKGKCDAISTKLNIMNEFLESIRNGSAPNNFGG